MARLRTPLDTLQTYGDYAVTLIKRFRDLSSLLDKPPASHSDGTLGVDVEAEETRHRRLVENWNGTVEEIRKIEGFSRFLFPPIFKMRDGPIIVLIASRSSCYTIDGSRDQRPSREVPITDRPFDSLGLSECLSQLPRAPTSLLEQLIAVISG
ncbi:uncharacterized protein HD556DRAFT_1438969 [Suillus plorans]|uniref:Uncharacterized protein n=1 Tax=Suillus plorans TaxID=116603 RepID=A0A9P7DRB9_9AGAM|nr:uncharacterized protein HD556DRAFT_1438969 [Suillus plorans]KAG1800971.1 hypothetical protein HD556DRAFT_1438969 [Suillus plorans]